MVRRYPIVRLLFVWIVFVEATVADDLRTAKEHRIQPGDFPQEVLDRATPFDRAMVLARAPMVLLGRSMVLDRAPLRDRANIDRAPSLDRVMLDRAP